MKQPELGRKIIELRKAKGYSQEELVEKCKLSVRTLQRIESGEVMPRGYTLRIIFEELDYEISELSDIPLQNKDYSNVNITSSQNNSGYAFLNIKCSVLIFISIIIVASLYYFYKSKPQDKSIVKKQIELNNEKYVSYYNDNLDSLLTFYDERSNFRLAVSSACIDNEFPDFRGQTRIKKLYSNYINIGKILVKRESKNMVINDSLVVDIGYMNFENNTGSYSYPAHYFTQWHLKNGKWKIENEMIYFYHDF